MSAFERASAARTPSGLVTFAFTDIEGSTRRWERDEPAMRDAVRRHDAIVRAAIVAGGGTVFKTIGDAFCAAFASPEAAVGAMVAMQRALAEADFAAVDGVRVRVALHTGTADERDGDYFGSVVNRVARLLAVAHGGQIVLSGATAGLVRGSLPPAASLRDLGDHRLKDLASPERVHQLLAPGLPAEFPALRSLDAREHNLPEARTSFVGREREIATIATLLAEHRLVTLVGTGGIGKTRASLHVAAECLERSPDGVWFVEFAPLASGDYVPGTVAKAMDLPLASGDATASLVSALTDKRLLLIFDNCEHVVEGAAKTAAALLRACPGVRILASSRQALGIDGETAHRLTTLPLPATSQALRAADAVRSEAIVLFVERARAADRRFTLTDDNAATVADICRRLDGIPLAIELAASRVRMLSPRQLHERLHERFHVLTGGSRDALPRQQTLRAMIDWSYDLLDERERIVFRRLSVFVDGFTLEGGLAVGGAGDLAEYDAFDALASLVDKSLVLAEGEAEVGRYRMLESTRAYAREKLDLAGETTAAAACHLRHLHGRFRIARDAYVATGALGPVSALLARELDDVRAALAFALASPYHVVGAAIVAWSERGWRALDLGVEGLARAETFLAALDADAEPLLAADLLYAISIFAANSGRKGRANETATAALARARVAGDAFAIAIALTRVAHKDALSGRFDAARTSLAEIDALGVTSPAIESKLVEAKAVVFEAEGDLAEAARLIAKKRDIDAASGNVFGVAYAVLNLAEIEHASGRSGEAVRLVGDFLDGERDTFRRRAEALHMTVNLAGYLLALDEPERALAVARSAIGETMRRDPASPFVVVALEHAALALALLGASDVAATLARFVEGALARLDFARENTERVTHDRLAAIVGERSTPAARASAIARGDALTTAQASALVLGDDGMPSVML